ncbi:MAG: FAD-binding protein, partial [Lachnospiraceae bacterium]|nr:FAD-binding protein [Lachnospiraceae bacterium]
ACQDIVNDPANPDVVIADTLEELAEKCGIEDVDQFLETVEEYNDMCESQDTLFYKPSKYMKPIKKGPFYAGLFRPSGYGTLGGIKINENCEVLDDDWNVIPGFYAAGTDTCTIYGDSYMFLLPGNTMGYCVNTGRFAGQGAAEYCEED